MNTLLQRTLVYVLALSILSLSSPVVVQAQIIGTLEAIESQQRAQDLQTVNGYAVLDTGGAPITLDPQGGPVVIGRDGAIRQGGFQVGTLGLFTIPARAQLARFENSGVIPDQPAEPVQDFTATGFAQGHTEGANINPVQEMARLIMVQRTFESAASAVRETENTLQGAIRDLGSTS